MTLRHGVTRPRRMRSALLAAPLAAALIAAGIGPAAAKPGESVCFGKIAGSGQATTPWWGGSYSPSAPIYKDTRPRGKMKGCMRKYKVTDVDKNYDYWGLGIVTEWTHTGGNERYAATVMHDVTSNKTARSQDYDATRSYTSRTTCGREWSVGMALKLLDVSTVFQVCKDYTVTLSHYDERGALWTTTKAGGIRRVSTRYYQKVPKGKEPTFTATVYIPQYTMEWNGSAWTYTTHFATETHKL